GGDESPLGGRERDQELADRVLAVDLERAGEADRHLRDAGEVLDVALGHAGIERELVDVLELHPGVLLDEALARLDDLGREVVLLVERDGGALDLLLGDRVLDLESETAERRAVE